MNDMILTDKETGKEYKICPANTVGYWIVEEINKCNWTWNDVSCFVLLEEHGAPFMLMPDRKAELVANGGGPHLLFSDQRNLWIGDDVCPLPGDIIIDVYTRNEGAKLKVRAGDVRWSWSNRLDHSSDVISYRINRPGLVYPDGV